MSSISSVEPLMSANSAVTVLRSPSSVPASVTFCSGVTRTLATTPGGGEDMPAPSVWLRAVPQLPQKPEVAGLFVLQSGQSLVSVFPHFPQKLLVEGLFVPHFEQRIDASSLRSTRSHLYHPRPVTD